MKCDKCLQETTNVIRLDKAVLSYEHDDSPGEPLQAIYQKDNAAAYCIDCAPVEIKTLVGKLIFRLAEAAKHI